jgi:hypothetical protein
MSGRNRQLASELASYLRVDTAKVEEALTPFLIIRFDAAVDEITGRS